MQPTLRAVAIPARPSRPTRLTWPSRLTRLATLVTAAGFGLTAAAVTPARAQTNQIDVVLPTAPLLARYGAAANNLLNQGALASAMSSFVAPAAASSRRATTALSAVRAGRGLVAVAVAMSFSFVVGSVAESCTIAIRA